MKCHDNNKVKSKFIVFGVVKHVMLVCVMYARNSFIPLKPGCTFTQKTRKSRVKGVVILPLGLWRVG